MLLHMLQGADKARGIVFFPWTRLHQLFWPPCSLPDKALSDFDYYMDTHKLRITVSNMKNANTVAQLESMRDTVLQNLSQLPPAPSVPFTRPPPKYQVVSTSPAVSLRHASGRRPSLQSKGSQVQVLGLAALPLPSV